MGMSCTFKSFFGTENSSLWRLSSPWPPPTGVSNVPPSVTVSTQTLPECRTVLAENHWWWVTKPTQPKKKDIYYKDWGWLSQTLRTKICEASRELVPAVMVLLCVCRWGWSWPHIEMSLHVHVLERIFTVSLRVSVHQWLGGQGNCIK